MKRRIMEYAVGNLMKRLRQASLCLHKGEALRNGVFSFITEVKILSGLSGGLLTPVILTTQEPENRRMSIQSQPGQIF
jgi:hypothetical protein